MTPAEVRALGAAATTCDVETAGRALGMGRAAAYGAVRDGRFPVPVLRLGQRLRVPTGPLLAVLGLAPPADDESTDSAVTCGDARRNHTTVTAGARPGCRDGRRAGAA